MNRKERRAASKQAKRTAAGTESIENKRSSYLFSLALNHYQRGQRTDAEKLCRQLLASEPNHADAFHLLGIIAHQAGRQELAV
jgi:Flp pilus assembly protein TadD